ncbi:hypothetical protein [Mesorhizobium sp. L103C131B0]|uniref:hypothetical protein n=1 Tax=Mesorhizobium sp. L103C131B0 TaxID=1287089 RepID=UPI001FDAB241|nr:hypothetical protein [Mesorhizobium sp. L103C131B0]
MKILDFVENTPANELHFLTFKTLCRAAGRETVDVDLMAAINILAGSRLGLLDAHALLVDDDQTEHELTAAEFAEARATGELTHPETGEPVPDYEEHLIPFFSPSERLMAELE